MKSRPVIQTMLVFAVLGCGAGHAAARGPATATAPSSPKLALGSMLRSLLSGDENGAMGMLVFSGTEVEKSAGVMVRQIIVTARLRRAIVQQFNARGQDSVVGKKEEQDMQEMLAMLGSAPVKLSGAAAEITLENGQIFHMVQKEGAWKVDYDKSQRGLGGLPTKAELERVQKQNAAIEQLTSEAVSRKFSTAEEIERRFAAIMTDVPATATAPAGR